MRFDKKDREKTALAIGLTLILIVALITFLKPSFTGNKSKNFDGEVKEDISDYPSISARDLQEKIKNNENISIIDIRSDEEYQIDHIIDSASVPLENLAESIINSEVNDFIVIAGSGKNDSRDAQAAKTMGIKGFRNVSILAGGISAWKNNNGQTVSWGDPTSFVNQSKITFISLDGAKKKLDNREPVYVLDIRSADKFSPHIPTAVNIPLNDLEKRRSEILLGKEIIVYGDTELEGFQAGVKLYDFNILSALVLNEGFTGWKNKGYPTE